jgi:lipoprotein-releasing system ATP-binding protein
VRERGKTIIAVTHDMGLAGRMDRRLELMDGRLIADALQRPGAATPGAIGTEGVDPAGAGGLP